MKVHEYLYNNERERHVFYALRVTCTHLLWPETQRSRIWVPVQQVCPAPISFIPFLCCKPACSFEVLSFVRLQPQAAF
jgi:hypothetical protein